MAPNDELAAIQAALRLQPQSSRGEVVTEDELDAAVAAEAAARVLALGGKVDKGELVTNVRDYGAKGDGTTDDTAAIRAAFASGGKQFLFPAGTYKIAIPQGESLGAFTNKSGITIDAAAATLDNSSVSYTADALTPIFLFDACTDVSLVLGSYIGFTLPTPTVHHGYRGATLVCAINGADGVRVDARATNLRYGVQTGEYGDPTKGGCKNFDIKIRGSMIGYPLAAYLAEGIRHDIDVDGIHRGVYIAGCYDVSGILCWRDQYIADTAYLITDALTSGTDALAQVAPPANPTTSRGCRNVKITSIDKGSTEMTPSTMCAGFNVSRVDAFTHSNIDITVHTVSTDTVSRYVGGFRIASDAKTIWNRYPFNFEPSVVFQNVTIRGVVDHSAQTLSGNTTGDVCILGFDGAHSATVQGLRLEGLTIHKSSGGTRACYLQMPGLADVAVLSGVVAPVQDWLILTNALSSVRIQNSRLGPVDPGTSIMSVTDSTLASLAAAAINTTMNNSTAASAGMAVRQKSTTLTLSGASTSWTAAIPSGALVLGVQSYVSTAITGATGYNLGVSGDISRYANTNTITVGGTVGPVNQAATEISPRYYMGTTDLVMTAKTSNFTGGVVRLILTYATFPAPTA